jgi:transposase-like protein
MKKKRHNYTAEEKVFILKRHLVEQVAVSDLCDEYRLQPKVFYRWQQQFFENGTAAFNRNGSEQSARLKEGKRIEQLEGACKIFCVNSFLG